MEKRQRKAAMWIERRLCQDKNVDKCRYLLIEGDIAYVL